MFTHISVIYQTIIKCLLCVRYCFRHGEWGASVNKCFKTPSFTKFISSERKAVIITVVHAGSAVGKIRTGQKQDAGNGGGGGDLE